jgi:hypothetical protein
MTSTPRCRELPRVLEGLEWQAYIFPCELQPGHDGEHGFMGGTGWISWSQPLVATDER